MAQLSVEFSCTGKATGIVECKRGAWWSVGFLMDRLPWHCQQRKMRNKACRAMYTNCEQQPRLLPKLRWATVALGKNAN